MPLDTGSSDTFLEEWEAAAKTCTATAIEVLRGLGCGEAIISYVASLRIYPRIPYLCAGWIDNRSERRELGIALALHAIGVKLLDDLVDGDTDFAPNDLAMGHFIAQLGNERYFEASSGNLLTSGTIERWLPAARYVRHEIHSELEDFDQWVSGAVRKALLPLYVEALYRERLPQICEELKSVFGLTTALGQVVDDWNDRERDAEAANLIVMINDGRVDRAVAHSWVVDTRSLIFEVLERHPPALAMAPFIAGLADRATASVAVTGLHPV
jgi:hypothetical protein